MLKIGQPAGPFVRQFQGRHHLLHPVHGGVPHAGIPVFAGLAGGFAFVWARLEDRRNEKKNEFHYKGGIMELVQYINRNRNTLHSDPVYLEGEKDGLQVEIAMQWNDGYNENVSCFAKDRKSVV